MKLNNLNAKKNIKEMKSSVQDRLISLDITINTSNNVNNDNDFCESTIKETKL